MSRRAAALIAAPLLACLAVWLTTPGQGDREAALQAERDAWRVKARELEAEVRRLRKLVR